MKQLPTEVLITIGKYLNQQDQKTCALVSRSWHHSFSRLVFSKAVLLTRSQVTGFLRQKSSKKQMTTSLHLIEPITDEEFEEFIQSCPKVKDLTLFINFTHRLNMFSTVSLITRHWSASLTKIRMDSLLLSNVLPLLSHQLVDVTADFEDLCADGTETDLIPMPKLKALYIENVEEENTLNMFSRLRLAYPDLTTLTVTGSCFSSPEDYSALAPFSKLRSFHLLNCDQVSKKFIQNLLRLIWNLDSFSLLRSNVTVDNTLDDTLHPEGLADRALYYLEETKRSIYQPALRANPNLRYVQLDYIYCATHDALKVALDPLRSLKQLRSLHFELKSSISDISFRERVSLLEIITTLPHLRNLTIYGLAHLETVDGIADYLVGKVGYYHRNFRMQQRKSLFGVDGQSEGSLRDGEVGSIKLRNEGSQDYFDLVPNEMTDNKECSTVYVDHRSRYGFRREADRIVWGIGEILTDRGARIMVNKKRYPDTNKPNRAVVFWNATPKFTYNSRFDDQSDFRSDLTVLRFEMATLRNQSYKWINNHCPLLKELHVLQTDIYPWCEIYLADLKCLHTFNWSLERFYEPFLWPVFEISRGKDKDLLQWDYESKSYTRASSLGCLDDDCYRVLLTLPPSLRNITVNDYKIDLLTLD